MNLKTLLRDWHRWVGFPTSIFLLVVSITGVWLTVEGLFGEEEEAREQARSRVSPVSTATPDAELLASLGKARIAVQAKAGTAPLDKVTWDFKATPAKITFVIGSSSSGGAKRFVCDAASGGIIKTESYEEESFLLRLHTGEVFGDGGRVLAIVWGVAFVFLILSGLCLYFVRRHPGGTGLRRIFWLLAAAAVVHQASPRAFADSPFYTDDPNFSPGWEIKAGATAERNAGGKVFTEVLDWNYAVVPSVRLNLTTYAKEIHPENGGSESGYGDTEFKVKWRFLDENEKNWTPALGLAPKIYFPTADKGKGLGDGAWRLQLPLQAGKTVGAWYHFAEVGYQWALDDDATDVIYGGAGTLYNFNTRLGLGTELFGTLPVDDQGGGQILTTLGLVYTFTPHWQLKTSISRTLQSDDRGGPTPAGVFYVVTNF